jgi:hypothetical protein
MHDITDLRLLQSLAANKWRLVMELKAGGYKPGIAHTNMPKPCLDKGASIVSELKPVFG